MGQVARIATIPLHHVMCEAGVHWHMLIAAAEMVPALHASFCLPCTHVTACMHAARAFNTWLNAADQFHLEL